MKNAMNDRRFGRRAVNIGAVAAFAMAASLLAGCGSSSNTSSGTSSADTPAAGGGGCPFSGGTATVSLPGPGSASSTLTGLVPTSSGCVDQVQLNLSPGLVPSTVGYSVTGTTSTTTSSGSTQLVITLGGAAVVGGGGAPSQQAATVASQVPASSSPKQLNHVKSINVSPGSAGALNVVLTLDGNYPFVASTSSVPSYVTVAIGTPS